MQLSCKAVTFPMPKLERPAGQALCGWPWTYLVVGILHCEPSIQTVLIGASFVLIGLLGLRRPGSQTTQTTTVPYIRAT